ncbi:MAG TPA: sigma-70 family RNA polymerase sigma factor [Terriglobia bacterium]|nr:sigma-70 family RNA polymerase sigma factor [Terriglobia bacterium]
MSITQQAPRLDVNLPGPGKRSTARGRTSARSATLAQAGESPSLEALLAQAAKADREAFLQIYDRWAPRVLGLIRRILPDADESEQQLEDVFAKLWRESARLLAARTSVAAWLMLMARARAVSWLRSQANAAQAKAPPAHHAPEALGGTLAWLPAPEAIARLEERRILLQKVLGQLPDRQRKALELVAYAGRSETELGEDLREPLARVQTELRAAAGFLRHRRRAVVGSWTVSI